jgi:thimet oligopeptidase
MAPLLRSIALALLCVAGVAAHADQAYSMPTYRDAAQVDADCQRMLADLKLQREALAQMRSQPGRELLIAFDALARRAQATLGPMGLLSAVHPEKAVRDACDACDLAFQAFISEFNQDPRLFALLGQMQPQDEIDRGYRRDLVEAFEDAGVALAPAAQARVRELNTEITERSQEFERRVREDQTKVAFTAGELTGVPHALWHAAPRDAKGRYLLGVDEAIAIPVLQGAESAVARERMWRALYAIGGEANLQTLAQLATLRREYAKLFGFDSYADLVLRRRMVQREADVQAFLASVKDAVRARELADLAELRAAKARHLHTPLEATTLQRWDVAFYLERTRRARFKVEQEKFRAALPPDAALKFLFNLAHTLFGITFTPAVQTLWHPDVRAFELRDEAQQVLLGTLYVDLFPRDGKVGSGAFVAPIRDASTLVGQRPAAALVTNLDRKGLTLDDLSQTLLHEFGHALHALLSQTRYAGQGGTNVKLDFVEAPSQMLEDWVYEPRVMALYAQGCPRCKPVSPDLLARADRARHFGDGVAYARQHLYASYDLAVHGKADSPARDPMAIWVAMEGATPLGHVRGSRLPASFGHIASGYAAGYYSYLWSLVLAADLRTAFAADRLDAATGDRYRRTILENGGQVPPAELMQQFLGRPSDSRAFFKMLAPPAMKESRP